MSALHVVAVDAVARDARAARRTRTLWIAAAALVMLAVTVQPFRDTDVWWHLALGRLITAHGIPSQEPFSFLVAAHAWVGQQWLYEVLLAGLVGAGGAGLASVVMGLVAVCSLALAVSAVPRAARAGGPASAFAVALSGLVMAQVVGVRGQVITLFGVAVVLLVVRRWREGHTAHLWVLPPLFLVWANMHAGFVAGFLVLIVALAIAQPAQGAQVSRRQLAAVLGLSVVATLLNPAGPGLYAYVAETFANPTLTQVVTEWASPDFHNIWLRLFEAQAMLLVALWVLGGGPDRYDLVLGLVFLVATLDAQRNVSLFAVIAAPQTAMYATRAWRLRIEPRLRRPVLPRVPAPAGLALVAAVAAAVVVTVAPQVTPAAAAGFEAQRYPEAAATYYGDHFAGQRVYSLDTWGGYLAYRFPEGRVVFLYDETAVFGDGALQRYLDIHDLRGDWTTVLAQEQIKHAILPEGTAEVSALHELGWSIDCIDSTSASLVMSAPASRAAGASVSAAALSTPLSGPAC